MTAPDSIPSRDRSATRHRSTLDEHGFAGALEVDVT